MSMAAIKAGAIGIGLLLVLSLIGGVMAYEQVEEGHEGVEKSWGAVTGNTLDPGAHLKVPIMQSVQSVEIRPRTYTMTNKEGEGQKSSADAISVKTVNGTSVGVDVTVRYRIDQSEADTFVQDWNNENQMEARLIRPTIRSDLRDEASDIQTTGSTGIYTRGAREELAQTARESLAEEFSDEPIVLEEVQIRNINLPNSIDKTLEEKESAKQQVEVEQQKIQQDRAKKQQRIVQAQAEAEEIEIKGEALRENRIVLEQQKIQALENGEAIYVPVQSDGEGGITLTRQTDDAE